MTQIAIPFTIHIQGQGGHGSRPDQSHNPIDCFLGLHAALKAFPSVDPALPCSCEFGSVGSDSRRGNIIPDTFTATGTFPALKRANIADSLWCNQRGAGRRSSARIAAGWRGGTATKKKSTSRPSIN